MEAQVRSQTQQFSQFWQKVVTDQLALVDSFYEELGKIQSNGVAQISANLDEATRLTKQSVAQAQQIAAQWRKLVLETAHRAADAVIPPKA